jgi:hypothetical protein
MNSTIENLLYSTNIENLLDKGYKSDNIIENVQQLTPSEIVMWQLRIKANQRQYQKEQQKKYHQQIIQQFANYKQALNNN